ncbi:SERTA domain-containing protein 2 [Scleropages formosus]|nr:SERTA domain-containing protein 2-like [Scleropages formosus]XP_018583215.1 SERTA domain-containing protein 2-like [Scleropages formosus]
MLGRGVKRKMSEYEASGGLGPLPDLPYPQQRQLVLDLCLNKLQGCHTRAEPSLHRSVLLANTLRHIQEELRREGGDPPAILAPAPPHVATPLHSPDMPPIPPDCGVICSPTGGCWPGLPIAMKEPGLIGGSQVTGLLTCPGCGDSDELSVTSSLSDEEVCGGDLSVDTRSSDSLFGSFEITNSTSYLTDLAFDDIFEDIDTSMYDSSDFSVLALPPARGTGTTTGPEDSLKPFPSCTSTSTLQLCLTDLNDLDHIMEILVGS